MGKGVCLSFADFCFGEVATCYFFFAFVLFAEILAMLKLPVYTTEIAQFVCIVFYTD